MFYQPLRLAVAFALLAFASACSHGGHDATPFSGDVDAGGDKPIPNSDPCETPNTGCACDTPDQVIDCGQVERVSGDYVTCTMGQRTCDAASNKWGSCVGDRIATMSVPPGQRTQNLGTTTACPDNPCDPYCQRITDNSTGLPLPDGGALIVDGGLTLRPSVPLPTGSGCTGLVMTPASQSITVSAVNTAYVKGEYFNQMSKTVTSIPSTWTVTATRTESNIDYDWGSAAPGPAGIPATLWSARWTGSIIPTTTEAYTFYTVTDDGARLWINGTLVDDHWVDQGATEWATAPINLTAGVPVQYRMEYYQNGGGDSARLRWSSASIAKQAIPAANMALPDGTRQRLTVTPASPSFSAKLVPAGCFPGVLNLAWTLDRYDVAAVTNGAINLVSAVPGTLNVTAFAGQFSATGQLSVLVNTTDTTNAPVGAVTNFAKAATATDPMTILYPYNNTVLPIGLAAPLIQWQTGGTAATAAKISLAWPATGTPTFNWSEIIPEAATPNATIPQSVWKDFENTGKGQDVAFSVQRLIAGVPAPAVQRTLHFSAVPVRGLIYYTQYQRGGAANMMVADPGSTSTAHSAFAVVDGCPVCHSVSANGNYFATSNQTYSLTNGGLSQVLPGGVLSPIADFVTPNRATYTAGGSDWRGFSWAPLTPDGTLALSTNNVYGNTKQSVVGIDSINRVVSVPTTIQSGGNGTGLLAKYYPNTTFTDASPLWKRIDPIVNFDFGTGSPGGLVPIDYSVRRTGQIQALTNEVYTFQIDTTDGVRLTINGTTVINQLGYQGAAGVAPTTFTGTIAMTAGDKVAIQLDQLDTSNESSIKLSWSSTSVPFGLVPEAQLYPNDGTHGLDVSYYPNLTATGTPALQRLEPDVYANWGTGNVATDVTTMPVDNFSSAWQTQLEAPYTGNIVLCVDAPAASDVKITFNSVLQLSRVNVATANVCTGNLAVTQGTLYPLRIDHVARTGSAYLQLRWQYGATPLIERIPTANFYASSGVPANGLTATFYGDTTAGATLAQNPTIQKSFTRYDPTIYSNWGTGRTEFSQLTSSDNFSARWTGKLTAPCSGVYEFQTAANVDDGGRLWIDQIRVASTWTPGAFGGGMYLDAGDHDFKFGYFESTSSASVLLQWRVNCQGSTTFVTIPTTAFKPTGDSNRSGTMRDGGDNGNGYPYVIWQTPQTAGNVPVDVSATTPANWGLSKTPMMVPSFSPDGTKLVFVDGDSSGGAGWRKGISMFTFDSANKVFKNRKSLVNTWPLGDAMKWPTFESDSRSIIYQSTVPADMCCRNSWTIYGFMGPTNYYEDPARLWSIDSQAANPTPVALTKLNTGERAVDANKSYQATMSPKAAGGYRWVVYTSTRPYGNTFNVASVESDYSDTTNYSPMLNYTQLQSQLWVSAIDDTPSGTTDRSHPGFWLPNQSYSLTASNGFVNERGFWVVDACRANTAACDVDEDCCGGRVSPKTSICRLDTPVTDPPTRHCSAAPPVGMCVAPGGACSTSIDCCLGSVCLTGTCSPPPAILNLGPANYERNYTAVCGTGTKPVWRFFDWQTVTPNTSSKIEFYAQTSTTGTDFTTLPVSPTAVTTGSGTGIVKIGTATGASNTTWIGGDVGALLVAAGLKSQQYLKVTIRFIPNNELTASPTLTNWRQNYSCVPAE